MLGGIIMSKWDDRYSTSREDPQSLEDDIMDAGVGKFTYETSTGETVRQPAVPIYTSY